MMKLTKAQKLAIGGATAPSLRGVAPRRKVQVYDRKTGEVKREIDDVELRKKILEAQEIEFSTFPPDPKDQKVCAGWEGECPLLAIPPKCAFWPFTMTKRNGEPWRCRACAGKRRMATIPEAYRKALSVAAREWNATRTPKQRSEAYRKGRGSLAPERRSEISRKAIAATTLEQRIASLRRAWSTRRTNAGVGAMKLSVAQRRMLVAIRDHGDPTHGLRGGSAHGGATKTLGSLVRAGLVTKNGTWQLTADGLKSLSGGAR